MIRVVASRYCFTVDDKSIVVYTSKGCKPCNTVKKLIESIEIKVPVFEVPVRSLSSEDIAELALTAAPTLVFLYHGKEVTRIVGAADLDLILSAIRDLEERC